MTGVTTALMDLNDFLRNTRTAAAPVAGHKRPSDANEATPSASASGGGGTDAGGQRLRRRGAAEGLNMEAAQAALAQERGTTSAQAQQERAQANLLSEQAAARMVHQVLEYVVRVELGGRHNAAKGGLPPFVPSPARLAAERALWTPAAGYTIHHVVPAALDGGPHESLDSLMSVVEKERVPEGVRVLRSSLQVCDTEQDLVGGVRCGMAPHLRAHVLEVLEKGLRGEAWLRNDAAVATQFSALGKPATPEKCPASVLLFDTAAARTVVAAADTAPVAPPGSTFSLSAFLNTENSATSSEADED